MKPLVIIISITISFSAIAADSLYHPTADAKEEKDSIDAFIADAVNGTPA
jgi:hypothetical protein